MQVTFAIHSVTALVDTGATVSCVDSRFILPSLISPCPYVALASANSTNLSVIGTSVITFFMQNRRFTQSFFVIRGLIESMILGMDFLRTHRARLDCVSRSLSFQPPSPWTQPSGPGSIDQPRPVTYVSVAAVGVRLSTSQLASEYPGIVQFKAGQAKVKPIKIGIQKHAVPIKQNIRKKALTEKDIIATEVQQMLALGVIRPSSSPWSSPIQLVTKKSGEIRFCIDFRKVNTVIVGDAYPMPFIQDLVDALEGSTIFSTLDLAKGYWQLPLHEEAKAITAFATTDGLYEFNVLPFGLCTASAIFQRAMHALLGHLPFLRIYMDDIIVFSRTEEEHTHQLRQVCACLTRANLALNVKKCRFYQEQVVFLGVTVGRDGIRPNLEKTEPILKMAPPQTKKSVQEFLGLVNFYRDFCPGLAQKAIPLYELLKKDAIFAWKEIQNDAFNDIKKMLTTSPLLHIAKRGRPFTLSTDASAHSLGAVLSQISDEHEFPIAYASRTLSEAESRYSVIEKELLAIVFAVKRFRAYLLGVKFTVFSDHNPLQYLASLKDTHGRIARWMMFLQGFSFKVQYRPGKQNGNADALTRCAAVAQTNTDPEFQKLLAEEPINEHSEYFPMKHDLQVESNVVWINDKNRRRKVVPTHKRDEILAEAHQLGHFGVKKTYALLRTLYWWPKLYRDVHAWVKGCQICQHRKNPGTPSKTTAAFTPSFPMELICWDIMGPLPISRCGHKYILVIIDAFSRWATAIPLAETSAITLSDCLWEAFLTKYGAPRHIHSDQGRNLNAEVVKRLLAFWGVKTSTSVAYFPQGNGLVERVNRTIQDILAKSLEGKDSDSWSEALSGAMFAYNTTPHSETGMSPHAIFFGRLPRLPGALAFDADGATPPEEKFRNFQTLYDKIATHLQQLKRDERFKVGDLVLVHRPAVAPAFPKKFSMPWKGPYRVVGTCGFMRYVVSSDDGTQFVAHATQVKKYITATTRNQEEQAGQHERPAGIPVPPPSAAELTGTTEDSRRQIEVNGSEPPTSTAVEIPQTRTNKRYLFRPRVLRPRRFI